jgi:hypothetical protein
LVLLVVSACATTGDSGEGDKNLPTAGVGPFRKLEPEEMKGSAPFVLEDSVALYREPTVLRDGDSTLLFVVALVGARDVIVRTRALDDRTFFGATGQFGRKPLVVLEPGEAWEGGALSGPALLRFRDETFLYYAGAEGIGVARSTDGKVFRKEPGPILGRDPSPSSCERSPPKAPTVFALPNGRLRMLYASGNAIGEAESEDGIRWTRLGLVLGPSSQPAPGSLLPNEKPPFDTVAVGDPVVVTRTTPAGRLHVRVLYTGINDAGESAIGFAARYGASGPLQRQSVPVYAVNQREAAPALLDLGETSYLYVQQNRRAGDASFVAIAAAFSPANLTLPPAADFPESP